MAEGRLFSLDAARRMGADAVRKALPVDSKSARLSALAAALKTALGNEDERHAAVIANEERRHADERMRLAREVNTAGAEIATEIEVLSIAQRDLDALRLALPSLEEPGTTAAAS